MNFAEPLTKPIDISIPLWYDYNVLGYQKAKGLFSFQFHYGTIITLSDPDEHILQHHFNSTMVRL